MLHLLKERSRIPRLKQLVLIVLLLGSSGLSAQVYYSVKKDYLKSKTERNNLLTTYKDSYPDTSVTEQMNYAPDNFMGNIGLASPDYIWRYGTASLGFRLLDPPLSNDRFRESDVRYYRTRGPYASLTGIAGSQELQIFRMLFTHTYKQLNVTLGFNRYTSKGFYQNQQTYTNNLYLSSHYTTRRKNAGFYFYVLNNGNRNQENGGIADGKITDSSMVFAKQLFRVNLSDASRDNRETRVMFNPWLRLNPAGDSLRRADHFLQLKSEFLTSSYRYKDNAISTDTFYKAIFFDSTRTVDSSHVRKFMNELLYTVQTADQKFGFSAGYKNEINQVWQRGDSVFMNHILQAEAVYRTALAARDTADKRERSFSSGLQLQYVPVGANAGNYKGESQTSFIFNAQRKQELFLQVLYEQRSADYIFNTWTSNHFQWRDNGYGDQRQFQARLGLHLNRFLKVSVFNQVISNYLYYDRQAMPRQYGGSIHNLGLDVDVNRIFFKHLGLGLRHTYQQTSRPEYVRVPRHISAARLFYSGSLVRNILQLQLGAQVRLYDAFSAYAYMPSTQVFYLQDNYTTRQYPYLDLYLSARIRPVSFFVKMENMLQGLVGPDYYFTPGYYQPDRALRFGLTWMFFD